MEMMYRKLTMGPTWLKISFNDSSVWSNGMLPTKHYQGTGLNGRLLNTTLFGLFVDMTLWPSQDIVKNEIWKTGRLVKRFTILIPTASHISRIFENLFLSTRLPFCQSPMSSLNDPTLLSQIQNLDPASKSEIQQVLEQEARKAELQSRTNVELPNWL